MKSSADPARVEQRRAARERADAERMRREQIRTVTKAVQTTAEAFVETFVGAGAAADYPTEDVDLAEEGDLALRPGEAMHAALTREIARLLTRVAPIDVTAGTIAQWLLTAYDHRFATDVQTLPPHAISVARLLAHLESIEALRARLDTRLSAAIARRAALLLWNQDAPEVPSEPEEDEADEREPPEPPSLCVDCGAMVPPGASCGCGA